MGTNLGQVLDTTGHVPPDTHIDPSTGIVTATLNLDEAWIHENGPGALICPGLRKMCAAYPAAFELAVSGCGGAAQNPGCTTAPVVPGETTADNNAVFLVRSTGKSNTTVVAAFAEFGVVSYRDYIMANRRGLNSLRQRGTAIPAAKVQK
jgi:hypothetical protein